METAKYDPADLEKWASELPFEALYAAWRWYHRKYVCSKGGRAAHLSREITSMRNRKSAVIAWRVRRARYGETGRKPVDIRLRRKLDNP